MTKKIIWSSFVNLNYETMPYRNSYMSIAGKFEFPVNRFNIDNFLLELPTASLVGTPDYDFSNRVENYKDRFFSLLDQVADTVYSKAGVDKKISLLYSGGIDSVCILAALQRNSKFKEFVETGRLFLSLTSTSINEYPWLFYNSILGNIPISALNYNTLMNDKDVLLVTGDGGDFLIGTSDIALITPNYNSLDLMDNYDVLYKQLDSVDHTHRYIELCNQVIKNCPFEISSINQATWWLSQCFVPQQEMVWPYVWSDVSDLTELASDTKVFRFFFDRRIFKFSFEYMSTNPEYHSYDETRTWSKQYIINHFGDPEYIKKSKVFSMRKTPRLSYKSLIYLEDNKIKYIDYIRNINGT